MKFPVWSPICAAALWLANQGVRLLRLSHATVFEKRAAASLLNTPKLRALLLTSFGLVAAGRLCGLSGQYITATGAVFVGILLARYLFFVSVVPLNMALTFVHAGER